MPTLPKAKKRSWIKTMPKHTRQHDNSAFYHSKAWRMTRKFYIKDNPLCESSKDRHKLLDYFSNLAYIKEIDQEYYYIITELNV